jgi:protease PrsW
MTSAAAQQRPSSAGVLGRWSWLLVFATGVALFEAVRATLVATSNQALVPTLLLMGALVMPATFVTFLSGRRLRFLVGHTTVAVTALAGGVVGVVLAGLFEYESLRGFGVGAMIDVAVIEETAKLAVPAALLLVRRPRQVGDGLILGVASGAGFAALETMGYAFTTIANSHGDLTTVSHLLLVRGLWSPAGHMAWTGITSAALYFAAGQRFSRRSCAMLVAAFGLAVALHTAWDCLQMPWAYALIGLVGLGTLVAITQRESVRNAEIDWPTDVLHTGPPARTALSNPVATGDAYRCPR